jgi:hypothetical protein
MDRRRFLARSTLAVAAVSRELQLSARVSQSRHWQPDGAGVLALALDPDMPNGYSSTPMGSGATLATGGSA